MPYKNRKRTYSTTFAFNFTFTMKMRVMSTVTAAASKSYKLIALRVGRVSLKNLTMAMTKYKVYHSHIRDDIILYTFVYRSLCCCQRSIKLEWMLSSDCAVCHVTYSYYFSFRFRLDIIRTIPKRLLLWTVVCVMRNDYHISTWIHRGLYCIDHGVL